MSNDHGAPEAKITLVPGVGGTSLQLYFNDRPEDPLALSADFQAVLQTHTLPLPKLLVTWACLQAAVTPRNDEVQVGSPVAPRAPVPFEALLGDAFARTLAADPQPLQRLEQLDELRKTGMGTAGVVDFAVKERSLIQPDSFSTGFILDALLRQNLAGQLVAKAGSDLTEYQCLTRCADNANRSLGFSAWCTTQAALHYEDITRALLEKTFGAKAAFDSCVNAATQLQQKVSADFNGTPLRTLIEQAKKVRWRNRFQAAERGLTQTWAAARKGSAYLGQKFQNLNANPETVPVIFTALTTMSAAGAYAATAPITSGPWVLAGSVITWLIGSAIAEENKQEDLVGTPRMACLALATNMALASVFYPVFNLGAGVLEYHQKKLSKLVFRHGPVETLTVHGWEKNGRVAKKPWELVTFLEAARDVNEPQPYAAPFTRSGGELTRVDFATIAGTNALQLDPSYTFAYLGPSQDGTNPQTVTIQNQKGDSLPIISTDVRRDVTLEQSRYDVVTKVIPFADGTEISVNKTEKGALNLTLHQRDLSLDDVKRPNLRVQEDKAAWTFTFKGTQGGETLSFTSAKSDGSFYASGDEGFAAIKGFMTKHVQTEGFYTFRGGKIRIPAL